MTNPEIKLKCLELAMEQAKREGLHGDRNLVAKITNEFYSHVVGEVETETVKAEPVNPEVKPIRRGKADKAKEIFD